MKGHVRIEDEYIVLDEGASAYQKAPFNPMAARIGTGGDYNDLEGWSVWVQTDWTRGVGIEDENAGGFLGSTLETRFPGMLILPPFAEYKGKNYLDSGHGSSLPHSEMQKISNGKYRFYFSEYSDSYSFDTDTLYLYFLQVGSNPTISVKILDYNLNVLETPTLTLPKHSGWGYIKLSNKFSTYPNRVFWLEITLASDEVLVGHEIAGSYANYAKIWNSSTSTWDSYNRNLFIRSNHLENLPGKEADFEPKTVQSPDQSVGYTFWGDEANSFSKISSGSEYFYTWFDLVSTTKAPLDLALFDGKVVTVVDAATSSSVVVYISDYNSGTFVTTYFDDLQPDKVFVAGGFFWFVQNNKVIYTNNVNVSGGKFDKPFIGPISVLSGRTNINAILAVGRDIYLVKEDRLVKLLPGDIPYPVAQWPYSDPDIGKGASVWKGDMYIPLKEDLLRVTSSGQIISIGPNHYGSGLDKSIQGQVKNVHFTTDMLLASFYNDINKAGTVWGWDQKGWHFLFETYPQCGITWVEAYKKDGYTNLFIRASHKHEPGVTYAEYANFTQNPIKSESLSTFLRFNGYLDTSWIYGNLKEIEKDWDSVFIAGENLSSRQWVTVYYRTEEDAAWSKLGDYTDNDTEISFPEETRTSSKKIQLRIVLNTLDWEKTPVVRAIRLKYLPMLTDKWRWTIQTTVGESKQLLDGTLDDTSYQRELWETWAKTATPLRFYDIDGKKHYVRIEQINFVPQRFRIQNGKLTWDTHISAVLRED